MGRYNATRESAAATGEADAKRPLARALRGSPVSVFQQDHQLRYVWVNNPGIRTSPDALIGKCDEDIFSADDAATLSAIKRSVLATGQGRRDEVRVEQEGRVRYYDLTVEPLHDDAGEVIGVTGAAIDITQRWEEENRQRFRARLTDAMRSLDEPHEVMHAAAAALGVHLHVSHVTYGELTPDRKTIIVGSNYHRSSPPITGQFDASSFGEYLGKPLHRGQTLVIHHAADHPHLDPAVLKTLDQLHATAFVAVPLLQEGRLVAMLVAHEHRPRVWSKAEISLIEEVAQRTRDAIERARAERALRESEAHYRLLSELTSDYAFRYRIVEDGNHVMEWKSGAFERITGYPSDAIQTVADWQKIIAPEDLPTMRAFADRLLTNKPQSIELPITTQSGERRWLAFDAQPIWDAEEQRVVRVIGAARDITERKRIEEDRQRLLERLEADRALIEQVIDQMPVGVVVVEAPTGKLLFVNAQVQQITGISEAEVANKQWHEAGFTGYRLDGTPWPAKEWPLSQALHEGKVVPAAEMLFRHPTRGDWVTLHGSAAPVHDASGRMIAAVSIFYDVTNERRAERATKLLARAGQLLASSLDYETTLRSVVQLSVPALADWGQVDIVTPQGELQCLAGAHMDPAHTELVNDLNRRYPIHPDTSWGPWAVVRTGEPEWREQITDDMLEEVAHDAEHLRILREAGLRSYISVPLKGRGRVHGVMTFITDGVGSGRTYGQADRDLALELGRRAGMAIEKALLYRDAQRELAERRAAERQLQALNETLEQRVAERTAEAEERAAQLRALAAELTQAEQRERRRLAQTLHDHLQQLLVAAKLRLHAMLGQFADNTLAPALHQIDDLLTQSIDASRSLTIELSPPILHDAGLAAALDWLSRWMRDKHHLEVTVHADPDANPRTEDLRVFLFNATRELLFNVVKHGGTRQATVELVVDKPHRVRLTVSDQGLGFNPSHCPYDRSGFGLFSIQQRLSVLGGEARIHSQPGQGTRIELLAPDGGDSP